MNTGLYLVSNEKMIFGASVILYPGMMESVAEKLDSNLLIIPSSIHEVLVLSDKLTTDWDYLRDMIHSVNKTEMVPQDILSDSLYYFDRETGKITIAS